MRRPLTSLVWCSVLFGGAVLPVYAQNSDDRAFVVGSLQARLESLVPEACDRSFAGATGRALGWANDADKAGERKEKAYEQMMAAPLGYGLVDHYAAKMNRAERDQKKASEQAKNSVAEVPAARAQTIHCLARIPQLRTELEAILADPVRLDWAVEQFRRTRQEVRTALGAFANEAQGVASGLIDGSRQGERVERLQQQWGRLQPWLAPEYVPATQTTSLNSLLGAVVEAETVMRFVQSAEDRVATLTTNLAAEQRRLPLKASLMERAWVDQQAHNLGSARQELAMGKRTLEGSRESLAHALADTARLSESSH
jgi:hypothetical protein